MKENNNHFHQLSLKLSLVLDYHHEEGVTCNANAPSNETAVFIHMNALESSSYSVARSYAF